MNSDYFDWEKLIHFLLCAAYWNRNCHQPVSIKNASDDPFSAWLMCVRNHRNIAIVVTQHFTAHSRSHFRKISFYIAHSAYTQKAQNPFPTIYERTLYIKRSRPKYVHTYSTNKPTSTTTVTIIIKKNCPKLIRQSHLFCKTTATKPTTTNAMMKFTSRISILHWLMCVKTFSETFANKPLYLRLVLALLRDICHQIAFIVWFLGKLHMLAEWMVATRRHIRVYYTCFVFLGSARIKEWISLRSSQQPSSVRSIGRLTFCFGPMWAILCFGDR